MIVESRRIVFDGTALRQAVRLYAEAATQGDVPQGVITDVALKEGRAPSAIVHIQQSGASQLREAVLNEGKILASLLLLCRSQKIPVPRNAEKTLSVAGNRLVLEILYKPRPLTPGA